MGSLPRSVSRLDGYRVSRLSAILGSFLTFFLTFSPFLSASRSFAQEKKPAPKPIKALLVTGGGYHDYDLQKLILTEGTAARAYIDWTIVHQGGKTSNAKIPLYAKDDWAKGYDIVIHNECFAEAKDPKWTERILKPHRDGIAAVVIHCTMHCYRDGTGEWFKFLGVTSHRHGSNYPIAIKNKDKTHPIMQDFGETWNTIQGELYWIVGLGENCKPLAVGYNKERKAEETCIWTNQYGKGKVFGTTIGHFNAEMADPKFLDTLTRGIIWACGKNNDEYLKPFDPTKTKFRWEEQAKKGLPKPQTKEPPKVKSPSK